MHLGEQFRNMVSRDYTKELGLKPATSKVPWPIAAVILAVVAGLVWFGIEKLNARASAHSAAADPAKPAAAEQGAN